MNFVWMTGVFLLSIGYISSIPPQDVLDSLRASPGNGTCDFSDVDAHNMVDSFLSRLPVELTVPDEESHDLIPGVTVGKFAVYSGLNNFRPLGPVLSYCRDGSRFLHAVLDIARDNLRVTLPWYTCEEARGAVGAIARGKFAVTFQVVKATANESTSHQGHKLLLHSGPSPLYVDSVYAFLEGANPSLESAFKVLGMMFSGLVREAWLHYVTPTLQDVFRNSTSLESPSFLN
uniref:Metastriate one of each protein family n=1 Tax=Rhipicephalus zambeziensis TaxID=60191 RepID=A0A224YNX3_9ACAR